MTREVPVQDSGMARSLVEDIRERLPDLRLLASPVDREGYRSDETAYLPAGPPVAVA